MGRRNNIRRTLIFHDYYTRLKNIALVCFEWENLPESCNARFLENTLFQDGRAIFVDDENMSYLNLRVAPSGSLNVYGEPDKYTAYSTTYSKEYEIGKCVFIRNNYLAQSTSFTLGQIAERMALIQSAIDININGQKTPFLLYGDDKVIESLKNLYNQYDGDKPAIYGSKKLQEYPINVLNTHAPFLADKLREEKRALWNEALEFLGIDTNPSDKKKERLIVSEVNSNNHQIEVQADVFLIARQEACKAINNMYGLNVNVKRRINNINDLTEPEGGGDNG